MLALVALVVCVVAIYLYYRKATTPHGPSPFKADTRRAPAPLVTDHKVRDKVLKNLYQQKKVPQDLDAIIVGSGIGAMTCAVMLSKAGKKVLVLEQHDQAGGCCHSFVEHGFEFDAGIHYIGEMFNNTMLRFYIETMTEGQLVWEKLNDVYDIVVIDDGKTRKEIPFASGREQLKAALKTSFPEEGPAIDRFFEMLVDVRNNMLGFVGFKLFPRWVTKLLMYCPPLMNKYTQFFNLSRRSLQDVLEELTTNKDLQTVLAYNFGDYGTLPSEASWCMHGTLMNHFLNGAAYPRGGASEIAFHMIPIIERAGGAVMVQAKVDRLVADEANKSIVGVQMAKDQNIIQAPMIISDAGVFNTFNTLLPTSMKNSSVPQRYLQHVRPGLASMSVYIGLKGTTEELKLPDKQQYWAFNSNDPSAAFDKFQKNSAEEGLQMGPPAMFISFPSTKDSTYQERFPGHSTCEIITFTPYRWFADWQEGRVMKRGAEYTELKMAFGKSLWEAVLKMHPQLRDKVEYFDVGSPLTNQYYLATPHGEIYGVDHDIRRFSPQASADLRPETGIPGLWLTGQDVMACGFSGASLGGLICASAILNRNLWFELAALKKKAQPALKKAQ